VTFINDSPADSPLQILALGDGLITTLGATLGSIPGALIAFGPFGPLAAIGVAVSRFHSSLVIISVKFDSRSPVSPP
jgi:hypothetical protein